MVAVSVASRVDAGDSGQSGPNSGRLRRGCASQRTEMHADGRPWHPACFEHRL